MCIYTLYYIQHATHANTSTRADHRYKLRMLKRLAFISVRLVCCVSLPETTLVVPMSRQLISVVADATRCLRIQYRLLMYL